MSGAKVYELGAASDDPKRAAAAMLRELARDVDAGKVPAFAVAFAYIDDEGDECIGHALVRAGDAGHTPTLVTAIECVKTQLIFGLLSKE